MIIMHIIWLILHIASAFLFSGKSFACTHDEHESSGSFYSFLPLLSDGRIK